MFSVQFLLTTFNYLIQSLLYYFADANKTLFRCYGGFQIIDYNKTFKK